MMMRFLLFTMTATLLSACASSLPEGAHPDDMSASEHRRAAARETREATANDEKYDPDADPVVSSGGAGYDLFGDLPEYHMNPTEVYRERANKHRAHAKAHLAAAMTLEQAEGEDCKHVGAKTRKLCPLLGTLDRVENLDEGVQIRIASGVDASSVMAHIRCHFAVGRAAGREGMPHCPLYIEGLRLNQVDSRTLQILAPAESVAELQHRMSTHAN